MHHKNIITAGKSITAAEKALVMIHGRGGTAEDILTLSSHLNVDDFALIAPVATNNSWYPYSFMAPTQQNEPWLSSALNVLEEVVQDIVAAGIAKENIYFLGFSQGACLTLDFLARHAGKFGGAVAFTGGLIGEHLEKVNYPGNFFQTPFFISTGNPDAHVPLERVNESVAVFEQMDADVNLKVYGGRPHTISEDEIKRANEFIFQR